MLVTVTKGVPGGDGRYFVPVTVSALACAVVLLVPRLHWPVAPLVVTAVTAWWGALAIPLLSVLVLDLAVARRLRAALACCAVAFGVNLVGFSPTRFLVDQAYVSMLVSWSFAIVIGLWFGNRRRLIQALAAERDHLRLEAQLREEAARVTERSRIAAEMHDVLAHRLSLIALHSGVLATRSDTLPAPVAERLGLLRTASTEALTDLREVLGALHEPNAPRTAVFAPALMDIRDLVDEARTAGQRVDLTTQGQPGQAPTTHRLAVYRIVQEALTNARKHADGAAVTVRVDYRTPATMVEITNTPGTAVAAPVDSGYGLIGLRERVTALGGHLNAGPSGAGAWRLAARIPHPATPAQNGTPE
ncbi:histidine kinase [Streptomyces sp. NBC_00257]|uniref:sensor histidine kinase n=1 Tax=unclassified Streptomyces TaxID=2593676 RepID=UPI002254AFC1|nr:MULTISPECIES: histidine kinase [unclassified Streptomyces]WTB58548.1 histidine kinase [Streptomyces sp. NBC_00826]WTH88573.1 histidine kinase [Streptomyces sp. NBC_00825]WTH97302.1 histidine kinase [Streptomyces sp. NBC_00822]MCX4862806.1 histidine kinase [Streptomyces sp. NBC_00906]MCX4894043.1 histidine kinase [Streptomyces sp. NBC_00892]